MLSSVCAHVSDSIARLKDGRQVLMAEELALGRSHERHKYVQNAIQNALVLIRPRRLEFALRHRLGDHPHARGYVLGARWQRPLRPGQPAGSPLTDHVALQHPLHALQCRRRQTAARLGGPDHVEKRLQDVRQTSGPADVQELVPEGRHGGLQRVQGTRVPPRTVYRSVSNDVRVLCPAIRLPTHGYHVRYLIQEHQVRRRRKPHCSWSSR
mmetsp:Transcript_2358/g.7357  ORF Transcript_2358/g.7357 Transcript_2358/m.7357 type:complete len:211 (-) Transcript_2358:72-704(-)